MHTDVPDVLSPLGAILDRYGYGAVVCLVMVESFGIPAPGQTMLIMAGASAATGHLDLSTVIALGALAATGGDSLSYVVGRSGGRPLVLRVGRHMLLTDDRLARAESISLRHGRKVVAAARFVDGPRQLNGVVAGLVQMPFKLFLVWNATGALVWATLFTSLGYLGGAHLHMLYADVRLYLRPLFLVFSALITGLTIRWALRYRAHHRRRGYATRSGGPVPMLQPGR
jgi:membrane protein DedA with SNARE-associated domain